MKAGSKDIPGVSSDLVNNVGMVCLIIDGNEEKIVRGGIRLQKMAYFCQYLGWSLRDYRLHYYGPFSQTLADAVVSAESEAVVTWDRGGSHTFGLGGYGREFMGWFTKSFCGRAKASKTRRLARRLSDWSREELEIAATIDYVANGSHMRKDDLLSKIGAIKPAYAEAKIEQAYSSWKGLIRDESLPTKSVRW